MRRHRRRRFTGQTVFAILGAGVGLLYALAEDWPFLIMIVAVAVGAFIGLALSDRTPGGTPRAIRDYARDHRLGRERHPLPAVTPLLLQPWGRTDANVFGKHPSGFEGRIGVFNFVRPVRMYIDVALELITRGYWGSAKGHHMLVALTKMPESRRTVPVLLCERRYGGRMFDSVEDVARGLKRVRLESVELDRQFEVFSHPRQEPYWVRRLFSPSLIVWLLSEEAEGLSFEIFDGYLSLAVPCGDTEALTKKDVERMSAVGFQLASRLNAELEETQLERPPALMS